MTANGLLHVPFIVQGVSLGPARCGGTGDLFADLTWTNRPIWPAPEQLPTDAVADVVSIIPSEYADFAVWPRPGAEGLRRDAHTR